MATTAKRTAPRKKREAPKQTDRVLKEYRCLAHGDFEAYKPQCPHGCDFVERVFKTPHAIGGQAKNIDKTLDTLASDFKLTDLRNDMGSVMNSLRSGKGNLNPHWGSMQNGIAAAVGGAMNSESVVKSDAAGFSIHDQPLTAPKAIPLSPKHVDSTDIRTVKPA
jgi:hypothetical protein